MRRCISLLLVVALVVSFAACGNSGLRISGASAEQLAEIEATFDALGIEVAFANSQRVANVTNILPVWTGTTVETFEINSYTVTSTEGRIYELTLKDDCRTVVRITDVESGEMLYELFAGFLNLPDGGADPDIAISMPRWLFDGDTDAEIIASAERRHAGIRASIAADGAVLIVMAQADHEAFLAERLASVHEAMSVSFNETVVVTAANNYTEITTMVSDREAFGAWQQAAIELVVAVNASFYLHLSGNDTFSFTFYYVDADTGEAFETQRYSQEEAIDFVTNLLEELNAAQAEGTG